MNITINTGLKGAYTILDINGNEIRKADNIITNNGMDRLVGNPSLGNQNSTSTTHWNRAFVHNLANLFIGSGNISPQPTDWQLQSPITTGFTTTNDPGATGTYTDVDPSTNNLTIKFIKQNQYVFDQPRTIREVGCNWDTPTNNTSGGIFSRAVINELNVNANDIIYIKYELTIQTNCHQLLEDMYFTSGAGMIPIPFNKTNIRQFPFYSLLNNGTASQTLNQGYNRQSGSSYSTQTEYLPPLFEDFGSLNLAYVGPGSSNYSSDSVYKNTGPRIWKLQIYDNNSLPSYSNILSTTITNTTSPGLNTTSSVENLFCTRAIVNNFNKNEIEGKWTRKIRFIFTPTQWKSSANRMILYRSSERNATNPINSVYYIIRNESPVDAGILTTFNTPYDPYLNEPDPSNPDVFVGFDYNFNFTRITGS